MSAFPAALNAALSAWYPVKGVKRPVTHRQGLTARVRALEKRFGGRGAAAAAVGVAASTWRSWFAAKRRHPSAASERKVDQAYQALLRDTSVSRTNGPQMMTVYAYVVADPHRRRYINRKPRRKFRADQLGREGLRPVVLSWQRGRSPEQVADVAVAAIRAAYGTEFAFEGQDVQVTLS